MRPRWQDWVIALAIAALAVTGVMAIWGNALTGLLGGGKEGPPEAQPQSPRDPSVALPPGPASGPF